MARAERSEMTGWLGGAGINGTGGGQEEPPACIFRMCNQSLCLVCAFDQNFAVTSLRRAPADQLAAAQFVERTHQIELLDDPGLIFRDNLTSRAVAADDEWIAPLAWSADTDLPLVRLPTDLAGVEHLAHCRV
jgi:hypothetical protein